MSVHNVAVYRHGAMYKVSPGTLLVQRDDEIVFWPIEVGAVELFCPAGILEVEPVELSRKKRSSATRIHRTARIHVRVTATRGPGCFEYGVYIGAEHVFAEGGSQPKIIVLE
ncbi:MAG: hypothetical protein HY825_09985 [Acidobacteria bacterium]|nr:hypothetical protein [Acidobacteriota bacterium]